MFPWNLPTKYSPHPSATTGPHQEGVSHATASIHLDDKQWCCASAASWCNAWYLFQHVQKKFLMEESHLIIFYFFINSLTIHVQGIHVLYWWIQLTRQLKQSTSLNKDHSTNNCSRSWCHLHVSGSLKCLWWKLNTEFSEHRFIFKIKISSTWLRLLPSKLLVHNFCFNSVLTWRLL